jgi:hypothetical protein
MPFSYRIDAEKRRVFTAASGVLTFKEVIGGMQRMGKDPKFDPYYTEIIDLAEVDQIELTMEQIVEVAQLRVFAPDSRRAIVSANPFYFGTARMYGSHHEASSGGNARVFSDMAEATLWVDFELPEEPPAPQPKNPS